MAQVSVTCDEELEDIHGSLLRERCRIRRGIFQGDSLSRLLFCMALSPLSVELHRSGYSYWMSTGRGETAKRQLFSPLLYMDNLKVYGRNPDQQTDEVWCGQVYCRRLLPAVRFVHQGQLRVTTDQVGVSVLYCGAGMLTTFVVALISSCKWYRSVMLGGPLIRSNRVARQFLHSCRRVCLVAEPAWKWDYSV